MAINVPPVANSDTFLKLVSTVNLLANITSNSSLTVGSIANGSSGVTATLYGNLGQFNSIAANSFLTTNNIFTVNINAAAIAFVGNSTLFTSITATSITMTNSNTTLTITTPNTAQISNGQFFLNANGSFSTVPSVSYPLLNSSVTTVNTFAQVIDSWNYSTYNIANYNICVIDNVSNNFYSSRISMMCGKGNVTITEYAALTSNTSVGVFSVSTNTTSAILSFIPVSQSTTVKFFRELI